MKQICRIIVILVSILVLGISGAWADSYQFMPTTQVVSYNAYSPSNWGGYWHSVIANSTDTNFNIVGANLVGSTLDIYTGWKGGSNLDDTGVAADLTLTSNGTTYMVRLYDTGNHNTTQLGEIFKNPSNNNSQYYFGPQTNYIYGGAYGNGATPYALAPPVPVWATSGDTGKTTGVTWTNLNNTLGLGYDVWEVAIDLSGISGFDTSNDFSFLYPSATCANSVLTGDFLPTGKVPLPPTALLLGTGLLGLGVLRRARKG